MEEVDEDVELDVELEVEVEVDEVDDVVVVVDDVVEVVVDEEEVVVQVNWSACSGENSAIVLFYHANSVTTTDIELLVKPFFLTSRPNTCTASPIGSTTVVFPG